MEAKAWKHIAQFILLTVQLGAFGCAILDFFPSQIILRGIARPHAWVGLPLGGYRIEWINGEGEEMELWVEVKHFEEGYPFELEPPSQKRPFVIAYPMLVDGRILRPAALLYPFDLDTSGCGVLSYASGYEAEVAQVLESSGRNPWSYPLERLGDDIVQKGKDPWDSAPWNTAMLLLEGKFSLGSFPSKKYRFDMPDSRQWWHSSPFGKIDLEGAKWFANLAEGLTTFVSSNSALWVSCQKGEFNLAVRLCQP